jgi:uncharacterized membrane protein
MSQWPSPTPPGRPHYQWSRPGTPARGAEDTTRLVYLLQAVSFFFVVTYPAAALINYIKYERVAGTWLESHFRWQLRTFWFSLLWAVLGVISSWLLIGYAILALNSVWMFYRMVRGYLTLTEGRPMYSSI